MTLTSHILLLLGITPNRRGYYFLQDAITIYLNNIPNIIKTKAIYDELARKYKTTYTAIDRAIRFSITSSWHNRNIELAEKIFGNTINKNDIPSNSLFISAIAVYLLYNKDNGER